MKAENFKLKFTIISRFSIKQFKCIITTTENLSLLLVTSDWYPAQYLQFYLDIFPDRLAILGKCGIL